MRFKTILLTAVLIELAVFVGVAWLVGLVPALIAAFGTCVLGGAFLRRPRLRLAGIFMLIPGFLTDLLGLILLLPWARRFSGRIFKLWASARMTGVGVAGVHGVHGAVPPWAYVGPMPTQGGVVEAEVLEVRDAADVGNDDTPALEA